MSLYSGERCSPRDASSTFYGRKKSKECKRDPRLGEYCNVQNPDALNFDEDHILSCILPELAYHRQMARENIEEAAAKYKARYDSQANVRPLSFQIGDKVYVKTSRPAGQAVGKTNHSRKGPYRIVDSVGNLLFKLQDVQTGALLASLKHGDALTFQPDEEESTLRRLQRDHPDIPTMVRSKRETMHRVHKGQAAAQVNQSKSTVQGTNDQTIRGGARPKDSGPAITVSTRPKMPVQTQTTDIQDIKIMPHLQKPPVVKNKKGCKTNQEQSIPHKHQKPQPAKHYQPSSHRMTLRGANKTH